MDQPLNRYVTVKSCELVAVPSGVVTWILPVFAPVGTVAVIMVSEFKVNVAFTPPNVTLVAPVKLVPLIVTCVPTGPLVGLKLTMEDRTRNFRLLVSLPPGVVTVTKPGVVRAGTTAVR